MKANETQHMDPQPSAHTMRWTWELEAIGALLMIVWLAGMIQFFGHMA